MGRIWIKEKNKNYGDGYGPTWPHGFKLCEDNARKWLRLARSVRELESPCYSKDVGAIIIDPDTNSLVSSGHNGPPEGCPPNDDPEYLEKVVWPQLTVKETDVISCHSSLGFAKKFGGCKSCPRKIVGAERGKRLELCTCVHAEADAIIRANRSVHNCYMFCYCSIPCIDCTKAIINAGIDFVIAVDFGKPDYSPYSSRWLYEHSATNLFLVMEDWVWLPSQTASE